MDELISWVCFKTCVIHISNIMEIALTVQGTWFRCDERQNRVARPVLYCPPQDLIRSAQNCSELIRSDQNLTRSEQFLSGSEQILTGSDQNLSNSEQNQKEICYFNFIYI